MSRKVLMMYRSKKIEASRVVCIATSNRVAQYDCCKTCNIQPVRRSLGEGECAIRNTNMPAFSLIEAITAVAILALVSSSVLVVVDRCNVSAIDSTMRMQAFEVARDNMEALLVQDSVSEITEYGTSEKYPAILWQTSVEAFYEPLTERMWVQAVCSAQYKDSAGSEQTVELTHWLTDLTKEQLLEMMMQKLQKYKPDQLIASIEEAARYAAVDVETIEQWVENGMLLTEDGDFIKGQLDLYKQTNGQPTIEDKMRLIKPASDLTEPAKLQRDPKTGEPFPPEPSEPLKDIPKSEEGIICGHTQSELLQKSFDEIWQIFQNCDEF